MRAKCVGKYLGVAIFSMTLILMGSLGSAYAKQSAPLDLDPAHAAFLVLHYQNDIIKPNGALGKMYAKRVAEGRNVENTKAVLDACRKKGILVIHVRFAIQPGHPEVSDKPSPLYSAFSKAGILVDGTWGADIIDELKPIPGEVVLRYASTNAFWGTELDNILHARNITDVMMAGIATARYVVLATTMAANDRQYYPIVLEDCCNDETEKAHKFAIDEVLSWISVISNSKEVIGKINKM